MLYRHLLSAQRKQVTRSLSPRYRWLTVTAILFVSLYVGGILFSVGLYFGKLLQAVLPGEEPLALLNRNLFIIFITLFSLRFFFQKTPRLSIRPYLHLPVSRARLVRFFQLFSLISIHNLFPLVFFLPFWLRYVLDSEYAGPGAWAWLAAIVLILAISQYANNVLRTLMTVNMRRFVIVAGALFGLILLDHLTGGAWLPVASSTLFYGLLQGNIVLLGQLLVLTVALFLYSSLLLRERLQYDASEGQRFRLSSKVVFTNERSRVGNLMLLELQLVWRNRRPRTYLFFALFFGTLYVALLLLDPRVYGNILMAALAGLFASGIFAVNHGQLMFSWESNYFDGLLSRSIDTQEMVLAKILTLQTSCVIFFVLSMPIFLGLAPELLPLHVAFLLYNAGVTSILMVLVAVFNSRRVDIEKGGGFFNYEGFSLRHWLLFIPTATPPTLLLYGLRDNVGDALVVLGAIGAGGVLLTSLWSRILERILLRRRYVMSSGFRQYEH